MHWKPSSLGTVWRTISFPTERRHSPNRITYKWRKRRQIRKHSKTTIAWACQKARPQMQRDAATLL
eukprot:6162778-Pleurochrysis_carterae.AAC.1